MIQALVVQNEEKNKMSARNMSIVLAPNLYFISGENPTAALMMSQKVTELSSILDAL